MTPHKLPWQGEVLAVQPRIRLLRSFDERSHTYLGYNLRLDGTLGAIGASGDEERTFVVATGVKTHEKHRFRIGQRRLAARTYATHCTTCVWGCEMPVEMIIDHWNPSKVRYRRETFCYGPKSCPLYKPGPTRKVPGRKGMSYEEEDWVDEDATSHRGPDD